ncbi:glycosyltransferase [Celeribacter indicus]|uniref:Glycosyl transferase family protein n=1 Tax=Celeribacter indicus TaxID=1208324 RepID=A0A0B5DVF0_9RHOB|nr:glycosyltransferase [Celeribacter indicus]AJE44721.1 glycosyl transferase family protein [Celeribacter indicus]SDX55136.1 Glycosyl transferase family 2 [Celeribacter indicus]
MKVGIVLGLHAPFPYIAAQIASIRNQSHGDWMLLLRDDGPPAPETGRLRKEIGGDARIVYRSVRSAGFVSNFLSGLCDLPDDCDAAALSDQDDIWHPTKLARAVRALSDAPDGPALYCARRNILTAGGVTAVSRLYRHPPSFANALVENIAPGNTIVMNRAALRLARETADLGRDVFAHDWWLYQLITGVGGTVLHDPVPVLDYRQHEANLLGAGERGGRWFGNRLRVLGGAYRERLDRHCAALACLEERLTPENRALLAAFESARGRRGAPERVLAMVRLPVRRQGMLSQIGFLSAVGLNRV